MAWIVGVDVGGTFTDFYAYDDHAQAYTALKVASTPAEPHRAIIEGLRELCARAAISVREVRRLEHGTTVATNTLIQKKGAKLALVTTRGFRDLLEIQRQIRPHMYSLQKDYPTPLVPRELRFEVKERVTANGKVLAALDEGELDAVVKEIEASGAEACAVCFLFAFLRPEHEQRVRSRLETMSRDMFVSLSSDVQPEFREYERLSTTVLNAYLQPAVTRYLNHLQQEFHETAPNCAIGMSSSRGGLMSVDRARRFPVRTALSGPAAGVIGAIHVARLSGRPNLLTLDMGGTSADVCLIRDYVAGTAFDRSVADFRVRLPMLDIETIGAGGGSIAWFERGGELRVGPMSAGAVPGPACYGKGGDQPTVSDANLILGRLSTRGLLGGSMALDMAAARQAFVPIASRLGFRVERAAHGVLSIVVSNMVRSLRSVSVERGYDPRQATLFAFGGAGALHATEVARSLGIREILVPLAPGLLCAQGLIVSDLVEDFVRTERVRIESGAMERINDHLAALAGAADEWFGAEDVADADRMVEATLDMRYVGQNFELPVRLFGRDVPGIDELKAKFFEVHEISYGYFNPGDPVEIVNFRLTARGRLKFVEPAAVTSVAGARPAPFDERPVWFDAEMPAVTRIYARDGLLPQQVIEGPAVIEQLDATTLVFPGDRARVDASRNLMIEVAA
jgi:N-methylhydantoinase A